MTVAPSASLSRSRAWVCVSVECMFPGGAPLMSGWGGAAVLIRRILSGAPAAVRRLACGPGPAPSFGGPLRDEGGLGSGEPAQGGGLAGQRLIMPTLGCALEDAGHLGQQVGPAGGKLAEFGHRGGLLVAGEVAPSGVVPGGSGELGDQEPVSSRRRMILWGSKIRPWVLTWAATRPSRTR